MVDKIDISKIKKQLRIIIRMEIFFALRLC